jgi:hypothetical protein
MVDVKWQDPPGNRRVESMYDTIASMLRAKPGQWALIREGVNAGISNQSAKRLGDEFEVVGRNTRPNGRSHIVDVYARFKG